MATIDSHQSTAQPGNTAQPGSTEPPADGPGPGRRHHPWRRRILLALGALVTTTVVVLALLAAHYQPVRFGGSSGGAFPGLPAGTGIRTVNTFGGATGQTYVPPQRGAFTLTESIQNTGSQTITILAVSILSPQEQAEDTPSGVAPWPLTPAGAARWLSTENAGPDIPKMGSSGTFATGVTLVPGEYLMVGIPLRMSGRCYDPAGWASDDVFYVKERFGIFTHWVTFTAGSPWVVRAPYDPGNRSSGPASLPLERPAKDLVCPAT